jgi:hypothetical protein
MDSRLAELLAFGYVLETNTLRAFAFRAAPRINYNS